MQKKKKYYLNVSSYKYKRECMKLFPNLLSKTQNNINKDQGISYQNLNFELKFPKFQREEKKIPK